VVDLAVLSWVSIFVLVEIFGRLLGGDPLGRESATQRLTGLSSGRTALALVVVLVIYEVLPVAFRGATLGKAMLGLRIVRLDTWGHPGLLSSSLRAVVLYAPLALPVVGLVLLAVVIAPSIVWPTRRGLHDLAAGTAVIRLDRGHPTGEP
jgi:uncharacterized RDD family membrane protein YckC